MSLEVSWARAAIRPGIECPFWAGCISQTYSALSNKVYSLTGGSALWVSEMQRKQVKALLRTGTKIRYSFRTF